MSKKRIGPKVAPFIWLPTLVIILVAHRLSFAASEELYAMYLALLIAVVVLVYRHDRRVGH